MNKTITLNNSEISYSITGKGSVVVFIHGFLENKNMWDKFSEKLSDSATVICIDLPGFGKSECIDKNHTMEIMADVVVAILEKENIKKAIIVGHSMGGYVSLALADKYPEMLSGLILFHSHASGDNEIAKINRERTIDIVNKNHSDFICNFIADLFAENNKLRFGEEIKHVVKESLKTKNDGIIAALRGMRDRPDRCHVLAKINAPVMIIAGKEDPRIPLEKIQEQIILPNVCEALIIGGIGHMGFIESPEITLNAVDSFIKRYSI